MIVLAEYPVGTILPLIAGADPKVDLVDASGELHRVKIHGLRLRCFLLDQTCAWCGRTGDTFHLERSTFEPPHLNLYHSYLEDGALQRMLMTRDHIIPVSRGGAEELDNLMTLCTECNAAKANMLPLQFVLKMTEWSVPPIEHWRIRSK